MNEEHTERPAGIGPKELILEKNRFEFELEVVLAEIEEYRQLSERLPTHKSALLAMSEDSRVHSIQIYAKINTLNQAINYLRGQKANKS